MHTTRDDSLLGTTRFISRHEDTQVYGAFLPKAMTNQAMLDSDSYKTYYAIATGAEPPKPKKIQMKSDSTISSEETPSKKKPAKAKKDVTTTKKPATKPKPTKKKAPIKADRGVLDGQQSKISGTDEGTDDDDNEDATEDVSDDDKGNDDDGDNDDNNDDSDDERTESDRDENPNLNQSNKRVTMKKRWMKKKMMISPKELYKDVNVNLGNEDADMTNADQGGANQQNASQKSGCHTPNGAMDGIRVRRLEFQLHIQV
ncbi:hypothetical protein Tco_1029518 [Tanacetum coccineum]|uniref:Uncharacterized protein n=1 Tax=Tanacetum coccineum TaxID=301880 RepID=A0ABQ5G3M8_9ASTR